MLKYAQPFLSNSSFDVGSQSNIGTIFLKARNTLNSFIYNHCALLKHAFSPRVVQCYRFGHTWLLTCVSVVWKEWGYFNCTMCCWQMASSQKSCETACGKLCNPWKLSRNWAAKHGCSRGLWAVQPEDQGHLRQKPNTQGWERKTAPGVHTTFLSEAADASHWFFGARH